MDEKTVNIYDEKAPVIVARHLAHRTGTYPNRFEEAVLTYFRVGEPTADIGSGSGRDTQWLRDLGFPVVGYDGSKGMLAEAQRLYPNEEFRYSLLPLLPEVPSESYTNILCSFVLMHLPTDELPVAIANLARILKKKGRLIVAFRPSRADGEREEDGRLFTPIDPEAMAGWMRDAGLEVLAMDTHPSDVYPASHWHLLVAERL